MKKNLFALIAMTALCTSAFAQVTVTSPWVRATVAAQTSTGAFMVLQSKRAARLVSVSSPAAGEGQIHQMEMRGDMMKMAQVDGIDLPAGQPVDLAAGSYHLMLMMLKHPLAANSTVPLTLVVQYKDGKREMVVVNAPVMPLSYSAPKSGH